MPQGPTRSFKWYIKANTFIQGVRGMSKQKKKEGYAKASYNAGVYGLTKDRIPNVIYHGINFVRVQPTAQSANGRTAPVSHSVVSYSYGEPHLSLH